MLTIGGYLIKEQLFESAHSKIYRGYREIDQQSVVVKMLKDAYPSPERIAWFQREYELLQSLNLIGVAEAYELVTYQSTWAMILEDFGGESLEKLELAGALSIPEFLPLAIKITGILGQIHGCSVIHKDINPSNIVLNPQSGEVKIIDFGIATLLSRENPTFRNPNVLEGTVAYISPEQTGRMNRSMDYRSDFYSLGVTFYKLLTGRVPFVSDEAIELVHAHIAKQPPPLQQDSETGQEEIPQVIVDIVMKLMAKNAEERYQSAYGLKADLDKCLQQLKKKGEIEVFPLAQRDISDKFQIPQKLYGREPEIDTLLAAFERTSKGIPPNHLSTGGVEMILVAGYSGVGKSVLVNEIHKPITAKRGIFIAGKYEQYQGNIPYFAISQAFNEFCNQLLSESPETLKIWREKILTAVGNNGQVLIEVIPELALVIGQQPPLAQVSPQEAQNRFHLVFQNFVKAISQAENPLVLFLDDLQWVDTASLKLLKLLMSDKSYRYLLIVGAYRVNEVDATHPLKIALDSIEAESGVISSIHLKNLTKTDVNTLLTEALNCEPDYSQSLADLVYKKTQGNAFFTKEFLKSLYESGLLTFEFPSISLLVTGQSKGGWQWNVSQIQAENITDNVVELMADKICHLDTETQTVLQLAACIGNSFNLSLLTQLYQKQYQVKTANSQSILSDLWQALQEGLVVPLNEQYKLINTELSGASKEEKINFNQFKRAIFKFQHDRVQQAAYALISPQKRQQKIHVQIADLLLENTQPEELEESIFDIVNQYNEGLSLIEVEKAMELARLNLKAGKKAKVATAYEPAVKYLNIGLDLLSEQSWQTEYDLTFALHIEAIEAEYLNTNFEQAKFLTDIVLSNANTVLDKVKVYENQILFYITQNEQQTAIHIGLRVLEMLEVSLYDSPPPNLDINKLASLPEMADPDKLAAMRILMTIAVPAYIANPTMLPQILFTMIDLCVNYGNSPSAPVAYAFYGSLLCTMFSDIETGYQFGHLALEVLEKFATREIKCKVDYLFNSFIFHWKESANSAIEPLRETIQVGLETGDIEFACYGAVEYCSNLLLLGQPLDYISQQHQQYIDLIRKNKQGYSLAYVKIWSQLVESLRGNSENQQQLVGEEFDEVTMLPRLLQTNNLNLVFQVYLAKTILSYLFKDYSAAMTHASLGANYEPSVVGLFNVAQHNFYYSLALLANCTKNNESRKEQFLKKVVANQQKMSIWSNHAPMNFLHKYELVEAEKARVSNQYWQAAELYENAIKNARESGYTQDEALAYELAAEFYLSRGMAEVGQLYMTKAHYSYQHWQATAKVKDLEKRHPQLFSSTPIVPNKLKNNSTIATTDPSNLLDITSVLKASQALGSEIVLDKLLTRMMKIVIENAGADRGFLLLNKSDGWVIEAMGTIGEEKITIEQLPLEDAQQQSRLPKTIINYVSHTHKNLVLGDAVQVGAFTQDPYIISHKHKSILCTPLLNQGTLVGIVYLENSLIAEAFTPDRSELLHLLSSQAAISLENARSYSRQVELTDSYSRFVPAEYLEFLQKKSITQVKLGDHVSKEMAVMFSDIRSFTAISENMTPQENFDFVNNYLREVSPKIRGNDGFIVKYLGDGMMAVFPNGADNALAAGIAKLQQVEIYNRQRQENNQPPIKVGVGIHVGHMMVGMVGETARMQGDAFSDNVNLTARLESLTKFYGVSLVISETTKERLSNPQQYKIRFLDKVILKGKKNPIAIFEVLDGNNPEDIAAKLATQGDFEKGLECYRLGAVAEAEGYFKQVLTSNPNDSVSQLYLERVEELKKEGVPKNWDGVWSLKRK
ncbi:MAG: AAA family ATPase [Spirulinaceae cyanobacterium]